MAERAVAPELPTAPDVLAAAAPELVPIAPVPGVSHSSSVTSTVLVADNEKGVTITPQKGVDELVEVAPTLPCAQEESIDPYDESFEESMTTT